MKHDEYSRLQTMALDVQREHESGRKVGKLIMQNKLRPNEPRDPVFATGTQIESTWESCTRWGGNGG